jgi:hypothetical protein
MFFAKRYTVKEISPIDWRLDVSMPFLFGFCESPAALIHIFKDCHMISKC